MAQLILANRACVLMVPTQWIISVLVHGNRSNKCKALLHTIAAVTAVQILTFWCAAAAAGQHLKCGLCFLLIKAGPFKLLPLHFAALA
jgi:hypothetical protein